MRHSLNPRINSLDLLKGLVMVIMALDHVRDYFHYSAFLFSPTDPLQSTLPIFFTRWITHFCAPAFCFLAGISAYLVGKRKTQMELSSFLIKRGLWLIFVELTLVGFAWYFDIQFRTFGLFVLWSLGMSMIVLAFLIHLPKIYILIVSLILIAGHNLLDTIHFRGNLLWAMLHDPENYEFFHNYQLFVGYPVVPWIAVMSMGYYFGLFYEQTFSQIKRQKLFNIIGIFAIVTFLLLRITNLYGDSTVFKLYDTFSQSLISFLNPSKYPPSFLYLLMTLGGTFLFLANSEKLQGKVVNFFSTFGRVPFFYYILHLYLIHALALVFAQLSGYGWQKMILSTWVGEAPGLKGYGLNLWGVYMVWILVIGLLYPICRKFDLYKQSHKEKWWLSYF